MPSSPASAAAWRKAEHALEARLPRRERQAAEIVTLEREAVEEHGFDGHRCHRAGHVVGAGEPHAGLQPLEARHAARIERHDLAVDEEAVERDRAEGRDELRVAAGHDLAAPAEQGDDVAPPLGEHAHAVVLDLEEPVRALGRPRGQRRQHEPLLARRHLRAGGPQRPEERPELTGYGSPAPDRPPEPFEVASLPVGAEPGTPLVDH